MKKPPNWCVGLSVLGIIAGTNAWAQDRRVTIVNSTSYTMTGFYASNADRGTWKEDILDQSVLEPGHEVTVSIDDGTNHCMYALKAVFDGDNEPVYRYGFDVCRIGTWTIGE
jgi:hypothetical protein